MKKVDDIMKRFILGFFVASIIFIGVGVVAYNYKSEDVTYTPSDNSWNVNNVKDAVDELYKSTGSKNISFISIGFYGASNWANIYASYANANGDSFLEFTGNDFDKLEESDLVSEAVKYTGTNQWGATYLLKVTCAKAGYYLIGKDYYNPAKVEYINVGDDLIVAGGGDYTVHTAIYLGESNPFE